MYGLSDAEMEDLLSLEDDVLQDSYLYHLPPDPTNIRLPPLLWVRLKSVIVLCVKSQHMSACLFDICNILVGPNHLIFQLEERIVFFQLKIHVS
jgi:hypothetical protein